jgi:hypothetical protein
MKNIGIKGSLYLNYFVFAILLNTVGIVILQVINDYNVSKVTAGSLKADKDLSALYPLIPLSKNNWLKHLTPLILFRLRRE